MTWEVLCADARDTWREADTLIYDPPWDLDFTPPHTRFRHVLAFCNGKWAGDIVRKFGAPTWVFTWNLVSPYFDGIHNPMLQQKMCFAYTDFLRGDLMRVHHPQAASRSRTKYGKLQSPSMEYSRMSDVYSAKPAHIAGHPHEKPFEWVFALVRGCTLGSVYDPFCGTGVFGKAAVLLGRDYVGSDLNETWAAYARHRLENTKPLL